MEENNLIASNPIEDAQFEEQIHDVAENNYQQMYKNFSENGTLYLVNYNGVSKFKSIRRAIKRGHCSIFGDIYPRRPFNNRKRNGKDNLNNQRKKIYNQIKSYG